MWPIIAYVFILYSEIRTNLSYGHPHTCTALYSMQLEAETMACIIPLISVDLQSNHGMLLHWLNVSKCYVTKLCVYVLHNLRTLSVNIQLHYS